MFLFLTDEKASVVVFSSFFILIVLKSVKEDELMLFFAITSGISRFHASPVALKFAGLKIFCLF